MKPFKISYGYHFRKHKLHVHRVAKILIVEDNFHIRLFCDRVLTSTGYQVLSAHNGQQALDCLQDELCDVCIIDGSLPDMEYWEIGEIIKTKINPDIGTLVLIAWTGKHRGGCLGYSYADRFLGKPVGVKDLLNAVHDLLEDSNPELICEINPRHASDLIFVRTEAVSIEL